MLGCFNQCLGQIWTQICKPSHIRVNDLKLPLIRVNGYVSFPFKSSMQVNVKAKTIQQKSQGHNFVCDGTFLRNTTSVIADKTASIDLTVWGEDDITTGCWYLFTNVSMRKIQGTTFLSSTRDTKFTKIMQK